VALIPVDFAVAVGTYDQTLLYFSVRLGVLAIFDKHVYVPLIFVITV
jgi:hypothetical protein